MSCYNTVPISIIPPTSQGVGPLVWQNGSQINRLNPTLNPALVLYDGSVTRFGDGSVQAPIYLPSLQQVSGTPLRSVGADVNGTLGYYNPLASGSGTGTANQIYTVNSSGTAPIWQTGIVGVSGTVTAAPQGSGLVGEVLSWSSGSIAFNPTGQTQELLTITSGSNPPLTNGDWQFSAVFIINCTNVTITAGAGFVAGISTATGVPSIPNRLQFPIINGASGNTFTCEVSSPIVNVIQNTNNTVYAVAQAPATSGSGSSVTIGCYLTARRMR